MYNRYKLVKKNITINVVLMKFVDYELNHIGSE